MSLHKSLITKGALAKHRNVLTRTERLKALEEEDRLKDDASVFGLPKVASRKLKKRGKTKGPAAAEKTEAEAAAEATPGEGEKAGKKKA